VKTVTLIENGKVDDEGRPQFDAVPVPENRLRGAIVALEHMAQNPMEFSNASGDIGDSSAGFKYAIDTLSFIKAEVTEQKFYEVNFADFLPVRVGRGNWNDKIFTNLSVVAGGSFAQGIIDTSTNNRFATMDAAVAQKSQDVKFWAKQMVYNIGEIQQALQANNWDPIMEKERSRKINYDLGLQEVAFLGLKGFSNITGLLNNADATINTTLITAPIYGLNAADISTFVATLISTYFTATRSTAMPTHFVIPYTDFLGLATPFPGMFGASAATFPVSRMAYLLQAFKEQTQNPNFKILPLAYAEATNNTAFGINKQCYALYRYDPRSMLMEVPISYTTTAVGTQNNFSFQNIGYSRFSGMGLFRNLELLYFQY
jgi:hypothetical protein